MVESTEIPGAGDFDFLHGSWTIANVRLTSRLTGSDEWEHFTARGDCRAIMGGHGNVDDFRPDWPGHEGFEGGAVRVFNPATGRWSISWFDNAVRAVLPPVHGAFRNGVGEFFGDDEHDGRPVLVRYRWSDVTPTSARWEQAFSPDQGATWETNWIMSFTRVAS